MRIATVGVSVALLAASLTAATPSVAGQAAATSAGVSAAHPTTTSANGSGAYLTIVMGRTAYAIVGRGCRQISGAVTLPQVAAAFQTVGLKATGAVVTDWIGSARVTCHSGAAYPTWDQLATLRDTYGWSFFSEGPDHRDVNTMSPAQQYAAACGSLLTLAAHGHTRAWGLFAYPGGSPQKAMQEGVTQRCFAFGRTYLRSINTFAQVTKAPYFQHTRQIIGGRCQAAALPCSKLKTPRNYTPIAVLKSYLRPTSGEWSVLQAYKFVRGAYASTSGGGPRWDCTSPDPRAHWTNATELYCLDDFLTAAGSLGPNVTVTDPAGVAQTWSPLPQPPTSSITGGPGSGAAATFTFHASIARSWFVCALDGQRAKLCDTGVSYSGLATGSHTFSVHAVSAYGVSGPTASRTFTTD